MANLNLTVAEYLAANKPLSEAANIVDQAAAISAMSVNDLAALAGNGVVSIDAIGDALSLSLAQIQALGTVGLSTSDKVKLQDTGTTLGGLTEVQVQELQTKGVDVLDATDNAIRLPWSVAANLADTDLSFDSTDLVTIESNEKLGVGLSASDIARLSDKGVDLIDVLRASTTITADVAAAIAGSNVRFAPGDVVIVTVGSEDLSEFSLEQLARLSSKGISVIDNVDERLTLSLDRFNALGTVGFASDDHVTVRLSMPELASLMDNQIANFFGKGVDTVSLNAAGQVLSSLSVQAMAGLAARGISALDAGDNVLSLSLDQFDAMGAMGLTASDAVTVSMSGVEADGLTDQEIAAAKAKGVDQIVLSDSRQALSALTVDQITALAAKGINVLDAKEGALSLSLAQYQALGTMQLSSSDVVSVTANVDAALSNGGNHLIMTDNAIRGTGNSFANTIIGTARANVLAGLDGNDVLNGGLGKDNLYGGSGKDIFVFNTKASSSNVDKLADFNTKYDTIYLENRYFTKLKAGKMASSAFWKGTKAHDSNDRVIYDAKKGYLYFDADGTGSKYKQVLFATTLKNLKMSAADFYVI